MKSLWLLTKKNLKLLIRSKSSALVIFFAPLLIILVLGLSYNTSSKYGLNIGIYSDSFTEDVTSFMMLLQEQEFKIVKYDTSLEECVSDIKQGFVHTCISVPSSLNVEDNQQKEITFYIDPSKINLVWMIQDTLGNKFDLKSQELSKEIAGNILSKLSYAKTRTAESSAQLNSVKEQTTAASNSAEAVKGTIESIDLKVPLIVYDNSVVETVKSGIVSKVKQSKNDLANARAGIEGATLEEGKDSILSSLDEAQDSLDDVSSLLEGNSSGFGEISVLVESLQHDLIQAQSKLASASEALSSSTSSLESTATQIRESVTAMATVQTSLDEMKSALEAQKVTEADIVAAPLVTKVERVGQESSYLNYSFPGLLVLVIMFSSLLLGTTLVMMEKNSPAFFRNYFLPLRKGTFVIATYLTNTVITLIQLAVILGVSLFFLKSGLPLIMPIAFTLLVSSAVFTFLGMAIGYAFKSEETGTLASISLGSFLLFVSGLILPLESISANLRRVTTFNPFVITEKVVRELFIFKAPFSSVWADIALLAGYALALFAGILVINYLMHRHFLEGFSKHYHKDHIHQQKAQRNNV